MNTKKIAKLQVTLRQWHEIMNKEMAISEDLRNMERFNQASEMAYKINGMIIDEMYGE